MAIHYPSVLGGDDSIDTESLDPRDYDVAGKRAMNALINVSENGGYIFAVYEHEDNYKIGFIEPNTEIEIITGDYGNKNGLQPRVAKLKALKFQESKILNSIDAISLTCVQPRQGTLCIWHKVKKRVENIFNDVDAEMTIDDLTPDLQEVLCSEFLRLGIDSNLPKIASMLTPVGRTMIDVDIVGLTREGKRVLVQVTYGDLSDSYWKIDKLQKYSHEINCELILFCKAQKTHIVKKVLVYDIEMVFDKFIETEVGKSWISMIK